MEGRSQPATRSSLSRAVPVATIGVVAGIMVVVLATSFAALIFAGPLARHLPAGIGLSLLSAGIILLTLSLTSGFPGSIGSVQDSTAAVMAAVVASIAGGVGGEPSFLTVVLAISLATASGGVVLLALGVLRLGNLIRYVPYPVVGGFLAGTGWLLLKGGVGVLAGASLSLRNAGILLEPDVLVRWLPGLAFAVVLLLVLRRWPHFLVIPGAVLAGVVVFYTILLLTGTPIEQARADGWALGPFPQSALWEPWTVEAVGRGDWGAILGQSATIATLIVVGVLALLLNVSGIELASGRDVDFNRELRAAGLANVLAGTAGGLFGFQALSLTALAHRAGARSRMVGVVGAAVVAAALVFGASLFSFFPTFVLGGLLAFLGLAFLVEWVVDSWRSLSRADYAIVLLILVTIAAFGFLEGVAVGLLVAVILFLFEYGRTTTVAHSLTAERFHSRVDRDALQREALRIHGGRIHILELQGFLFFGTANALLERIRSRIRHALLPPPLVLIIDFRRVRGIDSSATLSFLKARQLAESEGFTLVLTDVSPRLLRRMEVGGMTADGPVRMFPDLDRGLQWAEDRLLEEERVGSESASVSLWDRLGAGLPEGFDPAKLSAYIEPLEVPAGRRIIEQGDPPEDLYFLEAGRLSAMLDVGEGQVRLRTMGPGTVVGEISLYLSTPRTATIVTEETSRLLKLTRSSLGEMEHNDPELAAALHRLFARLLSERLTDTLRTIDALLD